MASEKSPAFQFYPKDFLTDSHVVAMTLQELGAYIRLLCLCWLERTLPADMEALARLCRVSPACFTRLWPALEPCFVVNEGRLIQPRLERERRKQTDFREKQRLKGLASVAARQSNRGSTAVQPEVNSAICNLRSPISDLRSADSSNRSKRPIYTSDRFAVFEWQLDELSKILGSHFAEFDLHAFFDGLTQQSRVGGLVIAKADVWPWLQVQVVEEAKRRGFPMAGVVSKPSIVDEAAAVLAIVKRRDAGDWS